MACLGDNNQMISLGYLYNKGLLLSLAPFLILTACVSQGPEPTVFKGLPEEAEPVVVEEAPSEENNALNRQRIMADMLYEARLAFDDSRLTSPAGDNAFDMFRVILDIDPGNEIALQGLDDIVIRYIQMADAAIKLGQYKNAETLLRRAQAVDRQPQALLAAEKRLQEARKNKLETFPLEPEILDSRSLELMVSLADIGQYIRNQEATFLINARTDEEGRWIYKIMREAVGGYRLRGNIGISAEPGILVTVPSNDE